MKNEYEVRGNVTAILINSHKYGRIEALISTNKLEKVKEFPNTWMVAKRSNTMYVCGKIFEEKKEILVLLHRWITNCPSDMCVDHINLNGLDNTDENLRIVTNKQNQQNKGHRKSKSGRRNVYWHPIKKKWYVHVCVDQKIRHIGYYDDIEEADKAAQEARQKYLPFSQEASA